MRQVKTKTCAIVVFGDIGRSPRMQNHAYEIAQNTEYSVKFFGYTENKPYEEIAKHPDIEIISLSSNFINILKKLPKIFYLAYALIRILFQLFQLFYFFQFKIPRAEFILVQNPPSVPVLLGIYIICLFSRTYFLVDFHNYGYTILQLNYKNKLILKIATLYEKFFGARCDYSFCVSKAMREDLKKNWNIESNILKDKPNTKIFQTSIPLQDKHNLLLKLNLTCGQQDTILTEVGYNGQIELRPIEKRPFLLVSSTSWTKDEDFSILLQAMQDYDQRAKDCEYQHQSRKLILLITGKGPEKQYYEEMIEKNKKQWKYIDIQTKWLESNDYPRLLACADLGICLHYSSSGVDLPMKVIDMFGSGLPVLAIKYKAIGELVTENYGQIFKDSQDLTNQLADLFIQDRLELPKALLRYRTNIHNKFLKNENAHTEWESSMKPIIENKISQGKTCISQYLAIIFLFGIFCSFTYFIKNILF